MPSNNSYFQYFTKEIALFFKLKVKKARRPAETTFHRILVILYGERCYIFLFSLDQEKA